MLPEVIKGIAAIALTLILCGVQKYLSTRKAWQLGAVVPLLSAVAMGALYVVKQVALSAEFVIPCAILLVLELLMWADGRHQRRKEELLRMKIKDIG